MIKYFTIEDLLKHYLQKKFHILFCSFTMYSKPDLKLVTYIVCILHITSTYKHIIIWSNLPLYNIK